MEYASLGEVIFKVQHYKRHSEDNKYEWTKINNIQAPSSFQFFGTENREIEIDVFWHIDFCNPLKELNKLKKQADEGMPYKLIIGKIPIGNFIIKNIKSDNQKIDANGNPILIAATILLEEFFFKELKTKKAKVKAKAVKKQSYIDKKQFVEQYNKGKK